MSVWKIDEIPQSKYTDDVRASYADYGDAGIVIFYRENGEGSDLPRDVSRFGNAEGHHYLELSVEEEDLLRTIHDSDKFAHTIVVITAANPMELGFLDKEEYGVDACLWHAGVGTDGIYAVADIFAGKVNPSGRLVDTYPYDAWSSPMMPELWRLPLCGCRRQACWQFLYELHRRHLYGLSLLRNPL